MKKYTKPLLIAVLIICIIVSGVYNYLIHGTAMPAHSGLVRYIQVTDDHLSMGGATADSASVFCGYDFKIKGDKAFVSLRYSLSSRFHGSGSYRIEMNRNLSEINYIYLVGKSKTDSILLWQRNP